ncbi:hypothetical protein E2C01_011082 [Portunus trituberculatus]|uniref:Uncharacterized protein n=1 Tax=Portunus trituberculatus TaxID=210409 RepID=A0A5B7DA33_PORTR|nr:hypothetical protein [Portunus trituberculatus]
MESGFFGKERSTSLLKLRRANKKEYQSTQPMTKFTHFVLLLELNKQRIREVFVCEEFFQDTLQGHKAMPGLF